MARCAPDEGQMNIRRRSTDPHPARFASHPLTPGEALHEVLAEPRNQLVSLPNFALDKVAYAEGFYAANHVCGTIRGSSRG